MKLTPETWSVLFAGGTFLLAVVGTACTALAFAIRSMVRNEHSTLLDRINGTYVRSSLWKAEKEAIEGRVTRLENNFDASLQPN